MALFRLLLFPFSLIYTAITWLRNKFYDWGWYKSNRFNIPIISIGNLEVGGSGKTPMAEYLIRLLTPSYKLATLSRGYGRKTKGFRWVLTSDDASLAGDEPLQLKTKYPAIGVSVCEKRVHGIQQIMKDQYQAVIMDDAYQHRAVKPGLSLLLFDYNRLNNLRILLPAGNFRETFAGRKRADTIIVSKAPKDLSAERKTQIKEQMCLFSHQKLYFSSINYSKNLYPIFNREMLQMSDLEPSTTVLLITGIAKPELILQEVKKYSQHVLHHAYSDHHHFSNKNMLKLVNDFNQIKATSKIIITTEKDAIRLKAFETIDLFNSLPIYKWPIEVAFAEDEKVNFDQEILEYVKKHQRIY